MNNGKQEETKKETPGPEGEGKQPEVADIGLGVTGDNCEVQPGTTGPGNEIKDVELTSDVKEGADSGISDSSQPLADNSRPEGDGREEGANSERNTSEGPDSAAPDSDNPKGKPVREADGNDIIGTIWNNHLKVVIRDPEGYIIHIDLIEIASIKRVSYNAIQNQLVLVLPEVRGGIGEQDVDLVNPMGHKTGGKRREIRGAVEPFKIAMTDPTIIRELMIKLLNITDSEFDEQFEGFAAHNEAQKKMAEVIKEKEEAEKTRRQQVKDKILNKGGEKGESGKILNMHGK